MHLLDRLFGRKSIIIAITLFLAVILIFIGIRYLKEQAFIREMNENKVNFLSYIEEGSHESSSEVWPEVYSYFKTDEDFLKEFSDKLFDVYSDFYQLRYIDTEETDEIYLICRDYHTFLGNSNFEMVVSAVFEDYQYDRIDYRTFINAMNDFYLFSQYESPKVVELLDRASQIYESRQSFLLAESKERTKDYSSAIEFYQNVIPEDVEYYPIALERIDECISLLRDQISSGD